VFSRLLCAVLPAAALFTATVPAAAQTVNQNPDTGSTMPAPPNTHYDLNVYPPLTGQSGLYDLNVSNAQKGPPGTIALSSATPSPAYSFQDVLKNTHGYVSTGVSSGSGHFFEGGVSIPLVPGKAELELGASTGQLPTFKNFSNTGKAPAITYDAYNVGLSLHPTDDVSAYIGVSGMRLKANGLGPYGYGYSGPALYPVGAP